MQVDNRRDAHSAPSLARKGRRGKAGKAERAQISKNHAQKPAQKAQADAFEHKLLCYVGASGTKGLAQTNLAYALGNVGKHHVHNANATHQQRNACHYGHEHRKRAHGGVYRVDERLHGVHVQLFRALVVGYVVRCRQVVFGPLYNCIHVAALAGEAHYLRNILVAHHARGRGVKRHDHAYRIGANIRLPVGLGYAHYGVVVVSQRYGLPHHLGVRVAIQHLYRVLVEDYHKSALGLLGIRKGTSLRELCGHCPKVRWFYTGYAGARLLRARGCFGRAVACAQHELVVGKVLGHCVHVVVGCGRARVYVYVHQLRLAKAKFAHKCLVYAANEGRHGNDCRYSNYDAQHGKKAAPTICVQRAKGFHRQVACLHVRPLSALW